MRHLLSFKIFENTESLEEINYYKEFPQIEPLTDLLIAHRILDYDELNEEDKRKIKTIFEKLGFSYYRDICYEGRPHYLEVLVEETEDYVSCHIDFYKHLDDWYEVIFYKKKRTPFGEGSYTQALEFNRWLCDDIRGIAKLLKKISEDYPWLKKPVGKIILPTTIKESINLEEINYFTEINMDDDKVAEFVEDVLKVSEYDITQYDVDYIIKTNDKLGLEYKHDIKLHTGRGGENKKVLMIWYNKGDIRSGLYTILIVNIRRIKDDYFYVFTDAKGKYEGDIHKEKKYFLCDGLPGLLKFFKHIKNDYLTF